MHHDNPRSNATEYTALKVELEVNAEDDLAEEEEAEIRCEGGVYVGCELTAFVFVAEEVTDNG